ncbi:hypothetical protein ATANTOWER_006234 [Ataeniobius toweri]|uniref:Uncharacterized protein n=1 Tax=Ataeniobius toweri TaxID=208326 RepID=A0ABU7CIQ9_9TELE|nr:hypothetical protein [Ataeniobius toweri]
MTYNEIKGLSHQALVDLDGRMDEGGERQTSLATLITCWQDFGTGTAPCFILTWHRNGRFCLSKYGFLFISIKSYIAMILFSPVLPIRTSALTVCYSNKNLYGNCKS